jgi:hypothetical protein
MEIKKQKIRCINANTIEKIRLHLIKKENEFEWSNIKITRSYLTGKEKRKIYENVEWHQRNYPYLTFKTDEEVLDFYENTHFIKDKELYEKSYIWLKYVSGSYESFYFETEDEAKAKYNEIKEKINSIDI